MNLEAQTLLNVIYARCTDDGGCMIWQGSFTSSGYPNMKLDGRNTMIRRHLAALKIGRPLNASEVACSTCNDKRCLCWEHIRVVTITKRRREVGAAGGYSSLTKGARISTYNRTHRSKLIGGMEAAQAIRQDPRISDVVALEYGVSPSMVRQIRRGTVWKPPSNPFSGLGAR